MPSSRPQVFGLSKDVTLAVLPRLYMQEVLIELGRRDIDFRQVLITTLHDVMVREYQQLDSQSEPTTPDVTCHVTRRVGYGFYDPSPWAGELVGRRGVPVDRYIESYRGDTHMDAPTDLSMRSVDREEVREQERRDTKESYQIVTARRTDQERWSHAHAYTEYGTHRQEMSHDHMPQEAENRKIFDRPSSEDEDKSPLERRDEYGRDPSTSSVSQDGEYRCREQEENNATLSSDTSASPDTRPPDRHSQSSIAETPSPCTGPQETSTSQYQDQSEGLSGTRIDTNLPSRNTENCDENSHERMTSDIANANLKEPETMDKNASGSVLSAVFHEAHIYKRPEEHRSRPSMNLQSSSMPPEPVAYAERQLQRSDTSSAPRPLIPSYHGQGGRSSTESHMEPVLSELTPSAERQLIHQTAQLCESSVAFPYRRRNGESSVTQPRDGPPSTVSTSLETLPGFQKLVQINGSTVWVPRTFDTISPLTYPPVHVNPGDTAHAHQSSPSSHQVENIEKNLQGEPVPMESQEAMPARHQVDNTPREIQTSEEQYTYQEQPPDFLTQGELSIVIKKEPLSPLSDSVNEEERELIQGVLSGASLTESLEQQMLNSGDAPRGTEGQNLERPPGSEHETGADEGSSSATSEISDGSRKWRKLYHCPLCSYFTRHRGNVKQHVRVHTRERPFKCPMCDYTGARKEHVQVHMKRHTGERPFKCDHCEYRTSRKPDLVKHLRTHSGDRPYACPKCAYRAAVQSALVNHLRTHTGEKPYKCPFCNHSTARRRELFKHMGRHSEEERNYAVELYGKR
ncbi:REST [Branchiostoma lanceolatum]|uniref:REST protein n=1 Tax=Branchiostoma lanceolatum TaxID=7740 RepID=A0A8J9Z9H4_BRALA|nr:REST [Branchiostoma lanceolatum]